MTVDYLEECGAAILDAAEAGLALATTGHAPPTSVFLVHGPPTGDWCCDDGELAVWVEAVEAIDLGSALAGAVASSIPQVGCAIIFEATYVISIHRCYPAGDDAGGAPSPAVWNTAAADLLVDLWAILTELADRMMAATLLPNEADCKNVTLLGAQIAEGGPTGACAGWEVRLQIRCNDPGPVGS